MTNEADLLMTTTSAAMHCVHARDGAGMGSRSGGDSAAPVARSESDRLAGIVRLGLIAGCTLALTACVTPQERRAMDQRQCAEFGFGAGTDGLAECMMGLSQQRTQIEAERSLQLQAQLAEQNRRREAQHDLFKVLSLQRSGDRAFPVCGASSDGGMDRRTMTWYGPNCRSR
ncbi:hypothetical protein [Methylobacterium sp. Leaf118]|uniref:hypothetical protein n=1 Tax=Methylobacterium sp. Leaf118 TaxID=2876562 RepID=UPI001E4CA588|nr:hypothetical protein [Methylobacterium sp. Leaf118]